MKKILLRVSLLSILVFVGMGLLFGGYYAEQEVISTQNGKTQKYIQKMWVEKDYLKSVQKDKITIVNFKKGMVYVLEPAKKTYFEMTLSQMKQMLNMMVQMMKQMNPNLDTKVYVEITNEKKKIGDYDCVKVITKIPALKQTTEMWYTNQIKVDQEYLLKQFKLMMPDEIFNDYAAKLQELSKFGFPVYSKSTTQMMGKTSVVESKLIKFEKRTIPESEFVVPSGYKKTSMQF